MAATEEKAYIFSGSASYNEVDIITPVPAIEKINHAFYQFYGMVHKIPILGWIAHASFYCILLFILTAYVWSRKKYRLFLPLLPLWLSFGICMFSFHTGIHASAGKTAVVTLGE